MTREQFMKLVHDNAELLFPVEDFRQADGAFTAAVVQGGIDILPSTLVAAIEELEPMLFAEDAKE